MKVYIVIPAYNTAHTLPDVVKRIPNQYKNIILVDDGSKDKTSEVAKKLGLIVIKHPRNKGYGATQKTAYKDALKRGADIVIMVHGDNQHDPAFVPLMVKPIYLRSADVVIGSRILGKKAIQGGMPMWKFFLNRLLTVIENIVLGMNISEFHSGYRAYTKKFLSAVPFIFNSDRFDFDTDILIQAKIHHFKIAEIPVSTIYEKNSSSQMNFKEGIPYGLGIIRTLINYHLTKIGIFSDKRFSTRPR